MADDVSLSIDGVPASVPPGTTIFSAARRVGIEIPHLCFDPELDLQPSSSCRLCIVEVEGARAPVASCSHPVAPGMVVHTDSEAVRDMRRLIVDLVLSDHPHDCLTCDKAGDCSLQDCAYDLGVRASEFAFTPVTVQPVQDGPAITYDRSKCILCGRCVAVCHDVQVAGAVDFMGRG
jgi:formate dehydrogenase alpha subunit